MQLTALINDTTGTLIASHYVNPRTKIAVIFGTGCNAAYMEKVGKIGKIKDLGIDEEAEMAINCEWVRFSLCLHPHKSCVCLREWEVDGFVGLLLWWCCGGIGDVWCGM